jgi:methanogenic corrinoid protein MtbC1
MKSHNGALKTLRPEGLQQFLALEAEAVIAMTEKIYAMGGTAYEQFGASGRQTCREDLEFQLEFLRSALEFGMLQPLVDYLRWLENTLEARSLPSHHLSRTLDWLAAFFRERMDSADGEIVAAALDAARRELESTAAAPTTTPKPPEPWPETTAFETALLQGRQREAMTIINALMDAGHNLVDIEMHVIQPALYQIGEKWQVNQVSVAQEHMATAIVQSVMTIALLRSSPPAPLDRRVTLACVDGNEHAIGLRMVADAFQLAGWDVQFLGPNVPTPSLVQQVIESRPNLVGLSVSFPQQLREVRNVIEQLSERLGMTRPPVIIGGLAINRFSQMADISGADACSSNPRTAIDQAGRMVRS